MGPLGQVASQIGLSNSDKDDIAVLEESGALDGREFLRMNSPISFPCLIPACVDPM